MLITRWPREGGVCVWGGRQRHGNLRTLRWRALMIDDETTDVVSSLGPVERNGHLLGEFLSAAEC